MANQEHLDILKQGVEAWNQWRKEPIDIRANLSGANLSFADLSFADLSFADLSNINLRQARLNSADLHHADLFGAYLSWADLSGANLSNTILFGAYFREANLSRANLSEANLSRANFFWPDIRAIATRGSQTAYQAQSWLWKKPISAPSGANLSGADLSGADLSGADLSGADLSGANLGGADLRWANLSRANLSRADLTGCFVYATSAWDVQLEETIQANLIITDPTDLEESSITVDNLEVAQFIYLLLNNKKIRDVIDTIAKKAILILGRFTPERKAVLDAIKETLRTNDYLPILFDFEKPSSRNFIETVTTLAHLSRFIIADLTDPSSVPHELATIVPTLVVPIVPLFHPTDRASHEYAMFRDLRIGREWVLPIHHYTALEDLLTTLQTHVIEPADKKARE